MPKVQTNSTSFTSGEFSPRLRGRPDLEKFNSSAELLRNVVVLRHGGITIRPSFDFKGVVKSSSQTVRILPFVYSRTDAFVLELGNLYMRVWKNGVRIEVSPGTPYEVATPWTQAQLELLDFTQGADTLIVTHPNVPVQRIQRFADASWRVSACPFRPGAVYEGGHRKASINLTISATTVGSGRTITSNGNYFVAADDGRVISWGTGSATITTVVDPQHVTVTVTEAFDSNAANGPSWILEGTPRTNLTPDADTPVGKVVNLTAGADAWRPEDVGRIVEINGGIVELRSIVGLVATGIIRSVLSSTTGAPTDGWVLKGPAWNAFDGYPSTCTFYQQRLWLGGTSRFPQTKWGSRSGLPFDFTPGVNDDSAVYKTFDSDDINLLQYLVASRDLLGLTYGADFECKGGVEKPITQTNDQITMLSRWGSALVRPEQAGNDVLYVQRGGRAMRVIRKSALDVSGSLDISVFSEHLFADGVRSIAWEQGPEQVCWIATGTGKLLALTYVAEQNVEAFCSGDAGGFVEWLVTVPDGNIDATYALVRRVIDGNTVRYIERLNWSAPPGQDSRMEKTGAAATVWTGFDHLEGETVAVRADDVYVGAIEVIAGAITIPREAVKVSAGIPYSARARLQSPEVPTGSGTSQGQAQSTHQVLVRFFQTTGCKINDVEVPFRQLGEDVLDAPPPVFTGIKDVTGYGWELGESPIDLVQDQPYPWTVLAVIRQFTVNAG